VAAEISVLVAECRLDLARLVLITAWCSVVGLREVPVGVPVVIAVGSTDYLVTASMERPRIRGLTWPLTCIVVSFTAVTTSAANCNGCELAIVCVSALSRLETCG
jgi:hypothetical protein